MTSIKHMAIRDNVAARTDEDAAMCYVAIGSFGTKQEARAALAKYMMEEGQSLLARYTQPSSGLHKRGLALQAAAIEVALGEREGLEFKNGLRFRLVSW